VIFLERPILVQHIRDVCARFDEGLRRDRNTVASRQPCAPHPGTSFAAKQIAWHGWQAFRRGLATNLHALGVEDKTIQAILRHSTLALTMNVYVKTVDESQADALDNLSERMEQTHVIQ